MDVVDEEIKIKLRKWEAAVAGPDDAPVAPGVDPEDDEMDMRD